jgi:hypothetical protein
MLRLLNGEIVSVFFFIEKAVGKLERETTKILFKKCLNNMGGGGLQVPGPCVLQYVIYSTELF